MKWLSIPALDPLFVAFPVNTPDPEDAKSILLVDDSFVLRDRLAMAFEDRGFRVAVAGNVDQAIEVYRREQTALAVVDLRMPGKSGLSLIAELKQIRPMSSFDPLWIR